MTEQHAQQNINSNPTFSRNVDQDDVDGDLTTPAAVLTNDDAFIVFGDDGSSGAYRANLSDVRTNPGHEVTVVNDGAVTVTVGTVEIDGAASGQTIEGGATLALDAGEAAILRASPPGTAETPATNWFIMVQP